MSSAETVGQQVKSGFRTAISWLLGFAWLCLVFAGMAIGFSPSNYSAYPRLAILSRCRSSAGGDNRTLGEGVSWHHGCRHHQQFDNRLQRPREWQSIGIDTEIDCDLGDAVACRGNRAIPKLPKQEGECAGSSCFAGACC